MLWITILLVLFIFQIATILIAEFRHPSKTVAWLVILFIIPLIGFVMYYFIAKTYKHRRKSQRKERPHLYKSSRNLLKLSQLIHVTKDHYQAECEKNNRLLSFLRNLPDSPICKYNKATVLTDASDSFKAMKAAIAQAQDHIHFEFYTIRADLIGCEFQQLLIRKAKEGVKVRVLYDGIGSYKLSGKFILELRNAGVETSCFLPPFIALLDKRLNYRNHRKIIVVDGKIGFFGGINIGDEYLGADPKLGYWRDTHFQMEGDAVFFLQNTFLTDWSYASGVSLSDTRYYPEQSDFGKEHVQIITSGPDAFEDTILEVYFTAISTAKYRIYITSPYFVPDLSILMALKTAAISGIDVRIIFPKIADTTIVHWASLSYMEELMQAGVRFYQYLKGFIHAKVLLVDDAIAFVGTANLDMRSFFSNFELNAVMYDRQVIERLDVDFRQDLKDSKELLLAEFQQRSRWQRGKEVFARLLSPLF
ncbi:MAG: cls [Bacilli bacterium]|nr:cls [Bacilli bacterium]